MKVQKGFSACCLLLRDCLNAISSSQAVISEAIPSSI